MNTVVKSRVVYRPGQIIFREGEPGSLIFQVERGRVEIWRGPAEAKVVLGIIPTGGIFGEMAILDDKPRVASASALEECVLVRIPADRIRDAMHKADPILCRLIHVMLETTRNMAQQLERLSADHARHPPGA